MWASGVSFAGVEVQAPAEGLLACRRALVARPGLLAGGRGGLGAIAAIAVAEADAADQEGHDDELRGRGWGSVAPVSAIGDLVRRAGF